MIKSKITIYAILIVVVISIAYFFSNRYFKAKELARKYELYYKFGNLIYKSESNYPYVFEDGKITHKLNDNKVVNNTYEINDETITINNPDDYIDNQKEILNNSIYVIETQKLKNLAFHIERYKNGELNFLYNKDTGMYLIPIIENEDQYNDSGVAMNKISPRFKDSQLLVEETAVTVEQIFTFNSNFDELIGKKVRIRDIFKIPFAIAPGIGIFGNYYENKYIMVDLKNYETEMFENLKACRDFNGDSPGCDWTAWGRIEKSQAGKLKLVVILE